MATRGRESRSVVLTGPEAVRIFTKNLSRNRRKRLPGRVAIPTLPVLARIVAGEDRVIVIQDTDEES